MDYKFFITIFRFRRLQFQSPLIAEEVVEKLNEIIEARTLFPLFKALTSSKSYIGDVSERRFWLRGLHTNKAFRPYASGELSLSSGSTIITVEIKHNQLVSMIAILIGIIFISILAVVLRSTEMIVFPIFGTIYFCIANYFFGTKVSILVSDLEQIFQTKGIEL